LQNDFIEISIRISTLRTARHPDEKNREALLVWWVTQGFGLVLFKIFASQHIVFCLCIFIGKNKVQSGSGEILKFSFLCTHFS
jgi:hypothetical protein